MFSEVRFVCKLFVIICVFSPFQIANGAFFAGSLCDLLYRFEEFCSIQRRNSSGKLEQLRKAIDSFHNVVVIRLNKVYSLVVSHT